MTCHLSGTKIIDDIVPGTCQLVLGESGARRTLGQYGNRAYSAHAWRWRLFYLLSNWESVQCNFLIFDNVTFIQFKICCCVQNFVEIWWFFTEIWRYNDFQNGGNNNNTRFAVAVYVQTSSSSAYSDVRGVHPVGVARLPAASASESETAWSCCAGQRHSAASYDGSAVGRCQMPRKWPQRCKTTHV